ncbi:MAG: ABC transporter ATP-binding protein [Legionellales bacterium RIFCSPHIGHO2_12_FULL_37_14]|nr:MAG: ABC transporter ATP-binding protein [Legionellales bacterium RIFCSPHIGHO2_12_FULL_37_14]
MLKVTKLTKSFKNSFAPVLQGISFELTPGDFCVVIGSNGSGKTTLFKTISGEYEVDKGHIYFSGKDVTHKNRAQYVSSVVQDVNQGTIKEMTLLENMVLSETHNKAAKLLFYRRYRKKIVEDLSSLGIGLEREIDTPLECLSGGQRQMVATLMAIRAKATFLLLDEHTAALDPKMQKKLMNYTASMVRAMGATTLMITHKLDDAITYGNRLIMLHKGNIVLDVAGAQKADLTIQELLALFHQYEDETLLQGNNENVS